MNYLVSYLNCGRVAKKRETSHFIVTKLDDIIQKIIPLLQDNLIVGEKYKDYNDFCQVVELMKNKEHLTEEGLNKIKIIKARMNRKR